MQVSCQPMYYVRLSETTKWYNMEGYRFSWVATCERCGKEWQGSSGELERRLWSHEYDDEYRCPNYANPSTPEHPNT